MFVSSSKDSLLASHIVVLCITVGDFQTGRQKFQDRSRGFSSIYASPIEQAFNLQNNTPKGHSLWIHESSCSECMEWSKIQCLLIREKLCLDPATLATDIASTTRCATDWAEHRPRHGPCRTLLRSCLSESCADHWDLTWVNLGYPWLSNVCFSFFFAEGESHLTWRMNLLQNI